MQVTHRTGCSSAPTPHTTATQNQSSPAIAFPISLPDAGAASDVRCCCCGTNPMMGTCSGYGAALHELILRSASSTRPHPTATQQHGSLYASSAEADHLRNDAPHAGERAVHLSIHCDRKPAAWGPRGRCAASAASNVNDVRGVIRAVCFCCSSKRF